MKRAAFLVLTLCGGLCPAVAADAPAPVAGKTNTLLGSHNANQPIDIAADHMSANLQEKTLTYTGNVIVTQGDIKMHADAMKVNSDNGKTSLIQANGSVVVDSPASGTATGDAGHLRCAQPCGDADRPQSGPGPQQGHLQRHQTQRQSPGH